MSETKRGELFVGLDDDTIRQIVLRSGFTEPVQSIVRPEQGVNNQTYFVNLEGTNRSDLVIKVRPGFVPGSAREPVEPDNPFWPRYTQALFGPYSNGDLSTLRDVSDTLGLHGSLRTPRVYLVDQSFDLVPAMYLVSEFLTGTSFDWWGEGRFSIEASRQLGQHLASMHTNTAPLVGPASPAPANRATWGIFERPTDFEASDWWPRFSHAYHLLLDSLGQRNAVVAELYPRMEQALARAVATGAPSTFALMCLDQAPTHYVRGTDTGSGPGVASMVDIEGHLWGPGAYELAMVEIWLGGGTSGEAEKAALRQGYEGVAPYPAALLNETRPAYQLMTWLEWMYCNYNLLHNEEEARGIEPQLIRLCERGQ
jgi:hypothetical protein